MEEEIVCPYCGEEQIFNGTDSGVFFSEGNHDHECYWCSNKFKVYTEAFYHYEVYKLRREHR